MNSHSQDKKLKNKSFMIKSYSRTDYKITRSVGLDVVAAIVSLVVAVCVWLFH